jgi:hypothetical protein
MVYVCVSAYTLYSLKRIYREMTVRLAPSRDTGDARGNATVAAGVAPLPLSPTRRPTQRVSTFCVSRFWALAGDSSDDKEEDLPSSPTLTRRTEVTVGDFICTAFKSLTSAVGSGRRKRAAFAPGGRVSWWPTPMVGVRAAPRPDVPPGRPGIPCRF